MGKSQFSEIKGGGGATLFAGFIRFSLDVPLFIHALADARIPGNS